MKCKATTVRHPTTLASLASHASHARKWNFSYTIRSEFQVVAITSNNLKGQMTAVLPHHDLLCPITQMRSLAFVLHFGLSSHTTHDSHQGKCQGCVSAVRGSQGYTQYCAVPYRDMCLKYIVFWLLVLAEIQVRQRRKEIEVEFSNLRS